jgi:hypothetical protein
VFVLEEVFLLVVPTTLWAHKNQGVVGLQSWRHRVSLGFERDELNLAGLLF